MFCRKCGANIDDNSKVCPICNFVIEVEQPMVNETEPPIINNLNANQYGNYNNGQNPNNNFPNNNQNYTINYYTPPQKGKKGFAIAGFVLSLCALPMCCCNVYIPFTPLLPILSVLALIFGIIGLKSNLKGLAITAICLGIIGLLFYIFFLIFFYLTPPGQEFQNYFWEEFKKAYENPDYYNQY